MTADRCYSYCVANYIIANVAIRSRPLGSGRLFATISGVRVLSTAMSGTRKAD